MISNILLGVLTVGVIWSLIEVHKYGKLMERNIEQLDSMLAIHELDGYYSDNNS